MSKDQSINELSEAVKLSPGNTTLRLFLGNALLEAERAAEAEEHFRAGLSAEPGHARLKMGLANAFDSQGKRTQALVVVEDVCKQADAPAGAFVLFARLLFRNGDMEGAVKQYKRALKLDPLSADGELTARLGVKAEMVEHPEADEDVVDGKVRAKSADEVEGVAEIERPKINFQDVGGMDGLKEDIRIKIILPISNPEIFKAYGKTIGGGILMYGPPGCGKTHLARATAGEIKASFMSIGISDVLDMWIGASERNLHRLFAQARESRPCVLFFDEVDALAASRSDMRHNSVRLTINQFLSELDGVQSSNEGVLILAATNAPWHLDSAFRRPGRFDRIVFVPPPDAKARASILRILCQNKPVVDVDFNQLAAKTVDFSGADLKAVIDMAVEEKLRIALAEGIAKPLTSKDLLKAAATIKPSTREWFASARNYALYSNQGGMYDDVLKYMDKR